MQRIFKKSENVYLKYDDIQAVCQQGGLDSMSVLRLKKDGRIAIINRGEPAVRFLNALADFNDEHGATMKSIALYTLPDQHAKFVRRADEAYLLGDALEPDPSILNPDGTPMMRSPYLTYETLKRALLKKRVNAVWVGWGFVAEHAAFVDLCDQMGVVFIGPSGDSMRKLGDKIGSKWLAEKAGVSVSPWSKGPLATAEEALEWAEKIGYPLVLKATSGGGGRGIRKVTKAEQVPEAFASASSEALKAFGDGTLFMEKMMTDCRHLEVQIVADSFGTVWPVGVRDCSVQRRNQKVIEEGPAEILTPARAKKLKEAACDIATASNYHSAGTAEFLYTPEDGEIYFMEMNTRLQVEHPVTEATTGMDLVKMQLWVAMGEKLVGKPPKTVGHAIEVRLNAEDPYNQFAPSPGKIKLFSIPGGPGIRVDSGVGADSEIPAAFDSMVAKIIAFGSTRIEALSRLHRVIKASAIVIENGTTNKSFLLSLLNHEKMRNNSITTGWLDSLMEAGIKVNPHFKAQALIVGCIELFNRRLHEERAAFFRTVSRGRPRKLPASSNGEVELKLCGISYVLEVRLQEPEYYQIHHEGRFFAVKLVRDGSYRARLYYNDTKYICVISERQKDLQIEVEGHTYLIEQDAGGMVTSQSPAVILAIHVATGDSVAEGDPLVTMEAMKMEMHLAAPTSGRVGQIYVKKNQQVGAGDGLLVIEQVAEVAQSVSAEKPACFDYDTLPEAKNDDIRRVFAECYAFMLGFGVHHSSFDALCKRLLPAVDGLAISGTGEDELLSFARQLFDQFFDLEFLFLKQCSSTDILFGAPDQNFFAFLQLMGGDKEHPHEEFLVYLNKALNHYDVSTDEKPDVLEEALIRIFYGHDNRKLKKQLLQQVMAAFRSCGIFCESQGLRNLLLEMIERARDYGRDIHDIVTDFYYQVLTRAGFHLSLRRLRNDANALLIKLGKVKTEEERDGLVDQIAGFPRPLIKYLLNKFADAAEELRPYYAQMLLRRVRSESNLSQYTYHQQAGFYLSTAIHTVDLNTSLHLAFLAHLDRLDDVLAAAGKHLRKQTIHQEVTLDLFFRSIETLTENAYAEMLAERMKNFPRIALLGNLQVVVSDGNAVLRCFHFIAGKSGYEERHLYRGILENQADRFSLDRLRGFQTERLTTQENIHLFYCRAETNPDDQRLIAFGEIRSLPAKGEPFHYEILHRDLLMIRKAMTDWMNTRPKSNFYWNQIIIYIRPLLHVSQNALLSFLRQQFSGFSQDHLEKVRIYTLLAKPNGDVSNIQIEIQFPGSLGLKFQISSPTAPQIEALSAHEFKKALARRRGINYPYEVVRLLTEGYFFKGDFEEYDLIPQTDGALESVSVKGRQEGGNSYGIVFGIISNETPSHPEGMERVLLLSDGNYGLGCLAERECRYVLAAIELAREKQLPLEWFPTSSGAKISMDNGTENLDWTAQVLREIIHFTQSGGEINIVVDAINVGAQSYWNAEATMMIHTKGCLIMTPRGTMVLTGKGALDYAGGVSAEDNFGIGGLHRIMGPNGQVHYPALNLLDACKTLFQYYALTYVAPGEKRARPHVTTDLEDRNPCEEPYQFELTPDFTRIGDIFSDTTNPGKKKPFDMRQLMAAVADKDCRCLERWPGMLDGETTLIQDVTIGGICTSLIGILSLPMKRQSETPNDGPDSWSGGTLFPNSSKKLARGLNVASGRRPVVILANLSGFDGSPESLRRLQLEYGAEIGRAVVNFDGLILFCVVSRYHGGAYVVFSGVLNPNIKVMALEGSFASVIGGAPAAAVVFPRQVRKRALADPILENLRAEMAAATEGLTELKLRYQGRYNEIYSEKQGEVAAEFEAVHTVERALQMGSIHETLAPENLRHRLIELLKEENEPDKASQ